MRAIRASAATAPSESPPIGSATPSKKKPAPRRAEPSEHLHFVRRRSQLFGSGVDRRAGARRSHPRRRDAAGRSSHHRATNPQRARSRSRKNIVHRDLNEYGGNRRPGAFENPCAAPLAGDALHGGALGPIESCHILTLPSYRRLWPQFGGVVAQGRAGVNPETYPFRHTDAIV